MSNPTNKMRLIDAQIEYVLLAYEAGGRTDSKLASQIIDLILDKKASKPKAIDTQLMFTNKSRFKNKCKRCNKYYMAGEPAFYTLDGSIKMHLDCATEDEKANCTFYQTWLDKNRSENGEK